MHAAVMRNGSLLLTVVVLVACGGQVRVEPSSSVRSCTGVPGAGQDCGVSGSTNCCASGLVTGGTFNRFNSPDYPATVSDFRMDVFEVTVGRFRSFYDAWPASRPKLGDGAHPKIPNSGWQTGWDVYLPATREALNVDIACTNHPTDKKYATWTDARGPNERMPIGCATWYEAFAFCAWDGGRLPTEAEYLYVAVGGNEQRKYPWGSQAADPSRAVLNHTPTGAFTPVGSAPAGASRWGILDLAGSRFEYTRDTFKTIMSETEAPKSCLDCITLNGTDKVYFGSRDLHFTAEAVSANVGEEMRSGANGSSTNSAAIGIRCVRDK